MAHGGQRFRGGDADYDPGGAQARRHFRYGEIRKARDRADHFHPPGPLGREIAECGDGGMLRGRLIGRADPAERFDRGFGKACRIIDASRPLEQFDGSGVGAM
jgi:hypothetical protein